VFVAFLVIGDADRPLLAASTSAARISGAGRRGVAGGCGVGHECRRDLAGDVRLSWSSLRTVDDTESAVGRRTALPESVSRLGPGDRAARRVSRAATFLADVFGLVRLGLDPGTKSQGVYGGFVALEEY